MYYWMYNIVLHLALPVIAGLLCVQKRLKRGFKTRFGFLDSNLRELPHPVIWVHAVSLGEALAAIPLLRGLKHMWPQGTLVVSTVTETGKEVVSRQLDGIALHCYAPLDFPWAVNRYLQRLNPFLFILMESELWPNLLRALYLRQVPTCLVNGRISSKSFSRYQLVRGFMRQVFGYLDLALVQSERDEQRMVALGASPDHVQVTGNMKFDQLSEQVGQDSVALISRQELGLESNEILWVAGSTHEREELEILEAYREVVRAYPQLVLLLAPRHIERIVQVEKVIRGLDLVCFRRSLLSVQSMSSFSAHGPRVIILDTRGELARIYGLGVVGFVGGTLVPVGGHNLLEPAQWGKPVLFGPFTDHCRDMAQLLIDQGGGFQVQDRQGLVEQMKGFLANPVRTGEIGRLASAAVQQRRGVVPVNLQKIRELVSQHNVPRKKSRSQAEAVSVASQSIMK